MDTTNSTAPAPVIDELTGPYWNGLQEGVLKFQRCEACAHAWLPPRHECPACLGDQWTWETASGGARLVSWVVYHVAYHPAFEHRLPYNVAIVALDEGPRLMSNVVGVPDASSFRIDMRLTLQIEDEGGHAVPRFTPA
jgi:uncharacterized OB-fold protein